MVKTYILAPNWTTAPPPDGPIKLGHLLDDLTEFVPINRTEMIDTSGLLNPLDTKTGFTASRGKLISGELGFAAKVIGLVGVGVGADIYYKKDKNDVLSVKKLITMTFDPTDEYIADTMKLAPVQKFMRGSKFRVPVFMITGLKIGRGEQQQLGKGRQAGRGADALREPRGAQRHGGHQSESWDGSSPFIVAFRVRKIWYRHGDIKHAAHNERVVMQDGAAVYSEPTLTLAVDDDVTPAEVSEDMDLTVEKDVEDGGDGEQEQWVIPKMDSEPAL
ncbi:hypothetical protein Daus18300_013469 [Diaporthe australafricana]|uniref:Uncharacterized protein n=1 Tax=Diaporthe australafricana TaxID=127596 RepID=A0ABR3VYV7_9PEZI